MKETSPNSGPSEENRSSGSPATLQSRLGTGCNVAVGVPVRCIVVLFPAKLGQKTICGVWWQVSTWGQVRGQPGPGQGRGGDHWPDMSTVVRWWLPWESGVSTPLSPAIYSLFLYQTRILFSHPLLISNHSNFWYWNSL